MLIEMAHILFLQFLAATLEDFSQRRFYKRQWIYDGEWEIRVVCYEKEYLKIYDDLWFADITVLLGYISQKLFYHVRWLRW